MIPESCYEPRARVQSYRAPEVIFAWKAWSHNEAHSFLSVLNILQGAEQPRGSLATLPDIVASLSPKLGRIRVYVFSSGKFARESAPKYFCGQGASIESIDPRLALLHKIEKGLQGTWAEPSLTRRRSTITHQN